MKHLNRPIALREAIDNAKTSKEFLLDPLFWQALGKSLGWYKECRKKHGEHYGYACHEWLYYWHRFIDHLAEGKDIESFFRDLTFVLTEDILKKC